MAAIESEVLARLHVANDVLEDFDLINTNLDAARKGLRRLVRLFEPRVRRDLLEAVTQLRVRYQNVFDKVLDFLAEEAGELVAGVEDLLVETLRVRVFEGQVAINHREENDTRTPEVSVRSEVLEAFYQLWCSITR